MNKSRIVVAVAVAAVIGATVAVTSAVSASTSSASSTGASQRAKPVRIEVFAPERGANAGASGFGWFVDMEVDFLGKNLQQAGFSGLQLTGPGVHNNVPPFPGAFSTGRDDRLPGLVVLTSTTNNTLPGFSGPGTNLANLFNLTGITNRDSKETELWDTWIVGAPIAGQNVNTTLTVAVIGDLNHDGIFNDAPNVVPDLNNDGRIDARSEERRVGKECRSLRDWSSDVCSSDLHHAHRRGHRRPQSRRHLQRRAECGPRSEQRRAHRRQIGRASCRERV